MKLYSEDDVFALFDPMLKLHICAGGYCDPDNPCEVFDQLVTERNLARSQIKERGFAIIDETPQYYDIVD